MKSEPIRVLHVNTRSDMGGGAKAFTDWIEEFDPTRVTVIAAAPDQEPWFPRLRACLRDRAYPVPVRTLRPDIVPRLVRLIRRHRIELVHTHGKAAGIHGRLAAIVCGVRTVHHLHGLALDHLSLPVRVAYLHVERWLARRTNCIVNVSISEQESALRYSLYAPNQSCIIPYGLRLERFRLAALHDSTRPNDQAPLVLCVARIAYQKGPDVTLRVFRHVVDALPEARLLWVGEGELREAAERLTKELGLIEQVQFPGSRHDIPDVLVRADVYLTTARWEGLPVAVLEAMAAGLPVVASRVVGNDGAVVDGVTGYLRPLDDEAAMAERLIALLKSHDLARRMGRAGRERAEREFALGPVTRRLEELYAQIAERGRAAAAGA